MFGRAEHVRRHSALAPEMLCLHSQQRAHMAQSKYTVLRSAESQATLPSPSGAEDTCTTIALRTTTDTADATYDCCDSQKVSQPTDPQTAVTDGSTDQGSLPCLAALSIAGVTAHPRAPHSS
eukprot:1762588-Rhodomonas_salina.1